MTAIAFAVGSMICAAMNDLVFKIYAEKKKSIGLYMAVIGTVWTLVFFIRYGTGEAFPELISRQLLTWGLISGIFSALANILFIESMARNEVGTCSIIYRLNLAPAALMAFFILGEEATLIKLIGIALAVGATLLFFKSTNNIDTNRSESNIPGLWIVVLAAMLRAGMGITFKYALVPSSDINAFLVINGFVWVISGIIYHLVKTPKTADLNNLYQIIFFGLISGFLVCGIVLFMALALRAGQASTVLPVAQLSFVITAAAGIIFLGEPFSRRKAGGFVMAILCIVFLGLEHTG